MKKKSLGLDTEGGRGRGRQQWHDSVLGLRNRMTVAQQCQWLEEEDDGGALRGQGRGGGSL
jgi:hypothetical protein